VLKKRIRQFLVALPANQMTGHVLHSPTQYNYFAWSIISQQWDNAQQPNED